MTRLRPLGYQHKPGERLQAKLPDAHLVKCSSTVSNTQMVDPDFDDGTPPMLICGDDDAAKARAEAVLVEFGWPGAPDAGDVTASRYLEALVPLWVGVGSKLGSYEHAIAVVQKPGGLGRPCRGLQSGKERG